MRIQMLKEKLIKWLGGYTEKEYTRIERKYQGLLDAKTDKSCVQVCNEYLWRIFHDLESYAKRTLYYLPSEEWADKMYNVIHNNYLRMLHRYVQNDAMIIYRVDTTLDQKDQYKSIVEYEGNTVTAESLEESIFKYRYMWDQLQEIVNTSMEDDETTVSKKEITRIMTTVHDKYDVKEITNKQ